MPDYARLMQILSAPRLNGSAALDETLRSLQAWVDERGIPHRLHTFRLYPYSFIITGLWLIASRGLLALAIWLRWGWPAALIALLGLLGGLVDAALDFPLITWIGAMPGKNLLIEFGPQDARQEVVLSAHYDSKTEFLDHHQRMFFVKNLRLGIWLTILLGMLGPIDHWLLVQASPWASLTWWSGVAFSLLLLYLAGGFGLNLSTGSLRRQQSQGAVDNGAACAILLGLAEHIQRGKLPLQRTRVTLALFSGEEINMQGARAYARSRQWPLPTIALNLEVMAQNGEYVYWEQDGNSFRLFPTSTEVNRRLIEAVQTVTGSPPRPAGPINSDGFRLLQAGVPTSVLGTYDAALKDRGFHGPADNLGRVVMERLPEGVEILATFIRQYDSKENL